MSIHRDGWKSLLDQLQQRIATAEAMGGPEKVRKQHNKGRLNARERIACLCDGESFNEYGALAGGNHPGGEEPLAGDGLVGGTGRIDGRSIVVVAEDFTVKGGSIGHPNAAKRTRLVRLALEQRLPLVLLLDGAGERADNQGERYPNSPNDLQLVADLKGQVPVISMVLGTSAGHGALTGVFADLIIMAEGSTMFSAGPPWSRPHWALRRHPRNSVVPPCTPGTVELPTIWARLSRIASPWPDTFSHYCHFARGTHCPSGGISLRQPAALSSA